MKYNDKNIEMNVLKNVTALLNEKGVKGWNMDELSERSNLAKNTLYRIIGSKEDVILNSVINHIKTVQAELANIIKTEPDYTIALKKIIRKFPELMHNVYSEYMQEAFNEYPAIEDEVISRREELTESLEAFIQKGIENSIIRKDINPKALIEIIQAVVLSYIKKGYKNDDLEESLSVFLDYVMNGIK